MRNRLLELKSEQSVEKAIVLCTIPTLGRKCNLPYHPSYVVQFSTLPGGSFARCCKPRSLSPLTNSQSSQTSVNLDSIMRVIKNLSRIVSNNFPFMSENILDINNKLGDTLSRLNNM